MQRPRIEYSAELVIGLVGPVGTDLEGVEDDLKVALSGVGYEVVPIRLSKQLSEIDPKLKELKVSIPYDERLEKLMGAGDDFRSKHGDDAMIALAVARIQEDREALRVARQLPKFPPVRSSEAEQVASEPTTAIPGKLLDQSVGNEGNVSIRVGETASTSSPSNVGSSRSVAIRGKSVSGTGATGKREAEEVERTTVVRSGAISDIPNEGFGGESDGKPKDRFVYLLHQLKRPDEVALLRQIYGPAFILVAVYAPRHHRRDRLAERIATSKNDYRRDDYRAAAERLIERDLKDRDEPHGQNVRDSFYLADVFVDARDAMERGKQLNRFVELLFGNSLHTPTRDEHAMFHAKAAALRSASLGRQVGSAISSLEGDVFSVGSNEVPKAGGGLYWPGDQGDKRDHLLGFDPSDRMKRDVFVDVLKRLKDAGWLKGQQEGMEIEALVSLALDKKSGFLKDAHFTNLIEFMRPLHAEMAAICDSARRGISLKGATMYVTAFPCHGCAKHIVASGIERVVYVEPYPKSLTTDLYSDSIRVEDAGEGDGQALRVRFEPFVGVAPRRYLDWFTMGGRKDGDGKVVKWEETRERAGARLGDWVSTLNASWERESDAFTRIMGTELKAQGDVDA